MGKIIYPSDREVARYLNHGITPVELCGLNEGMVDFRKFMNGKSIVLNNLLFPVTVWTRGDFNNPNAKPRIVVASSHINVENLRTDYKPRRNENELSDFLYIHDYIGFKGVFFSQEDNHCRRGQIVIGSEYECDLH
ncbi:hypothetical protein GOV12_07330 [Candidatus Pacearchaeota archaeon]|nr:hypothetical protein [Candidatus Pacearchaeota archaeon]